MKSPVLLLAASLLATAACNNDITGLEPPSDPATETFAPSLGVNISAMTRTEEGVYYLDQTVGTGAEVTADTDSVRVTYALYLKDGRLVEANSNVLFVLDALIPGFRIGLKGMKLGGRRKIVIPSELGYGRITQYQIQDGQAKAIKIPRQSTLIFDIDLLTVHNPPPTEPPAS